MRASERTDASVLTPTNLAHFHVSSTLSKAKKNILFRGFLRDLLMRWVFPKLGKWCGLLSSLSFDTRLLQSLLGLVFTREASETSIPKPYYIEDLVVITRL